MRRNRKIEFGDFQTPTVLARRVCELLRRLDVSPRSVIEPTCGTGSFLQASFAAFPDCARFFGSEINSNYAQTASALAYAEVRCESFFDRNWSDTLCGFQEPLLVIGNPPWVTNSAISALGGKNLPTKSNFQRANGLDAITGKSNFDISEWMLVHLLERLSGRRAVLAMLCKTVVARKVLRQAWDGRLPIAKSAVYLIDAAEHFGASVNACLLVCFIEPESFTTRKCSIYPNLEATVHESAFAYRDGKLIADVAAMNAYGYLYGKSSLKWRSGVKHDCTRVMELHAKGSGTFENGLGEVVSLESNYLYPMLKSSELVKSGAVPPRYMLVTQPTVGASTSDIQRKAPKTWDYLQAHADRLDRRKSAIYRNRPRFSVFGVGPYSFAPWKVAISGLYKHLDFVTVGPKDNKPVVLDDTCYFLSCYAQQDATQLAKLLNSRAARGFFRTFIFWDAKRPITAELLDSLDLRTLAHEAGIALPTCSSSAQDEFPLDM